MTIYRYATVSPDNLKTVNELLTRGWRPYREVPLNGTSGSPSEPTALVVLERDDTGPVAASARLGDDVPVELIEDVPLLNGLTHEELSELVEVGTVRHFSPGEAVFEKGTEDSSLCVILDGEVELHLPSPGIDGVHIMQIGERDAFGESSFFSGRPHAVLASAVTDLRLFVITRDSFDELLQASRPVAWKIAMNAAGILGVRLQETDEWLSEILQQEEDARIAHAWHSFRESAGRGGFTSHRFFGT